MGRWARPHCTFLHLLVKVLHSLFIFTFSHTARYTYDGQLREDCNVCSVESFNLKHWQRVDSCQQREKENKDISDTLSCSERSNLLSVPVLPVLPIFLGTSSELFVCLLGQSWMLRGEKSFTKVFSKELLAKFTKWTKCQVFVLTKTAATTFSFFCLFISSSCCIHYQQEEYFWGHFIP